MLRYQHTVFVLLRLEGDFIDAVRSSVTITWSDKFRGGTFPSITQDRVISCLPAPMCQQTQV